MILLKKLFPHPIYYKRVKIFLIIATVLILSFYGFVAYDGLKHVHLMPVYGDINNTFLKSMIHIMYSVSFQIIIFFVFGMILIVMMLMEMYNEFHEWRSELWIHQSYIQDILPLNWWLKIPVIVNMLLVGFVCYYCCTKRKKIASWIKEKYRSMLGGSRWRYAGELLLLLVCLINFLFIVTEIVYCKNMYSELCPPWL